MIVLSFFTSDELFYGAKHHLHSKYLYEIRFIVRVRCDCVVLVGVCDKEGVRAGREPVVVDASIFLDVYRCVFGDKNVRGLFFANQHYCQFHVSHK